MVAELAENLHQLFVKFGYKWKVGGQLVTPTPDDIEKTLDRAMADLYAEGMPVEHAVQMEVGRLIIRHDKPGTFDVYLQIGSINDTDHLH